MIKKLLCSIFDGTIGYSLIIFAGLSPMSKTVIAPILFFGPYVIIVLSKSKFGP